MRGQDGLSRDYFEDVVTHDDGFILQDKKKERMLSVSKSDVVFTLDGFQSGHFDLRDLQKQFSIFWQVINASLKVRDVRRIGIVCEYRFRFDDHKAMSIDAVPKAFQLFNVGYVDKLNLRYETRLPAKAGGKVNLASDEFDNVIVEVYDSSIDADNPELDALNVNIDVQHYFAPTTNSSMTEEALKLVRKYEQESEKILQHLKARGIDQNARTDS